MAGRDRGFVIGADLLETCYNLSIRFTGWCQRKNPSRKDDSVALAPQSTVLWRDGS